MVGGCVVGCVQMIVCMLTVCGQFVSEFHQYPNTEKSPNEFAYKRLVLAI